MTAAIAHRWDRGLIQVPIFCTDLGATRKVLAIGATQFGAAGVQLEAVSADAADDAAGTGARTLELVYLDDAGEIQVETLTMDGTTPTTASAAVNIVRLLGAHVKTTGSVGANVGAITVRVESAGATHATIAALHNAWSPGAYQVPTGYVAHVERVAIWSEGTADIQCFLTADVSPVTLALNAGVFVPFGSTSTRQRADMHPGLTIPAGATVRVEAVGPAGPTVVSGTMFIQSNSLLA